MVVDMDVSIEGSRDVVLAIQEITVEISSPKTSNADAEVLLARLEDALTAATDAQNFSQMKEKILKCGIQIWNVSVGKAGGLTVSLISSKMRSCALKMASLGGIEESDCQLALTMALATAKAWIDCEKYTMAEKALNIALEFLESKPEKLGPSDKMNDHRFAVFLHLAVCAFKNGDSDTGKEHIEKATPLARTTEQRHHLTLLCYNFGVESCNCGFRTDSSSWLELGVKLGKEDQLTTGSQQAKSLRLWATNLMHVGGDENLGKAVELVNMANKEDLCASGILLKLRILLSQSLVDKSALSQVIEQLAGTSDITMESALSAVSLLQLKKMHDNCNNLLGKLLGRFCTASERNRLLCRRAEVLLEMKRTVEAEQILKKLIGSSDSLEEAVVSEVKGLCWKMGQNNFKDDVCAAGIWLDMALPLFGANSDEEFHSEFLRLKAVCLMESGNLDEALVTAKLAESHSSEDANVLLLMFKLALMAGKKEEAKSYCQKILDKDNLDSSSDCSDADSQDHSEYIIAVAKVALEHDKDIAIECLEQCFTCISGQSASVTILKCLVRLKISDGQLSREEGKSVLNYLKSAVDILSNHSKDEIQWFLRVAWNLALQHVEEPDLAYEFYVSCIQFSKLVEKTRAALVQQKRCLLLAAAAAIESAKREDVEFTKKQTLNPCLEHIQSCRKLCLELSKQDTNPDITTPVLLMLYEFEVYLALGDPKVEQVLESAISLPQTEPKTFEILADLVMEYQPSKSALAARSLKIAIKKQLQQTDVDFNKCSKTFHTLIELAMKDQTSSEQAWGYYMDVMEVLDNMAQDSYPELEVLWLLTKAWNCGIQKYREMKYSGVLDWLGVAMRLVNHLTTFKSDYDLKLQTMFKQVKCNIKSRNPEQESDVTDMEI